MRTKKFWYDALERAASTAAQGAIALIGMDAVFNPLQADWKYLGGVVLGMAILSLFKSMAASQVGNSESASLVP